MLTIRVIRPRGREGLGTRLPQVPPYQLVIRTILPLKETATPNTGEFKPNVIQLEAQKGFSVPRLSTFRSLTVDKKMDGRRQEGLGTFIMSVSTKVDSSLVPRPFLYGWDKKPN